MCTYKFLRGIEELEKLDLIEPSSREAIERIVRSVRLQLRLQFVTLAHSLGVLLDVAERASKLSITIAHTIGALVLRRRRAEVRSNGHSDVVGK